METFVTAFADELEKLAEKNPGILHRIGGKLRVGAKVAKYGIPIAAAYALWNAVKGVTEGHRELREEGQI
jgi:hypothetical protein